ncbi:type II toxin-antitoxin system VapC family toxin [Leifsonia sp. H3M29-4]|uniref:type II toxin-antitoxin system VapC family toxin n=1 Tax=Salinibacterium metalliresistens TaxID=3031321 RepID=UPI0023D9DA50|nr:type II toxin-antitoxin system VapC family toxin [Salinibacterium metalliresistens]MDF1479596.1 type II toxin-antitoxin system VapC family toxin [Salinibacterium metalliresistens]
MILLDTNVLSEPLRQRPDAAVLSWLAVHPEAAITAITVGELLVGVGRLPAGARRESLATAIDRAIGRADVLDYDEAAARAYARIQEQRRGAGHPLAVEDGMIAAICLANDAALATRNTRDFEGLGVELIDPWEHT